MKAFAKFAKINAALHPGSGIGFGCMGITSFYGAAMEEDAAMALLKTVYDNGCRHFDTAEAYRNDDPEKHNEKVLGRFFKTVPRESYTVGTKYFPVDGKYDYDIVKSHLKQSLERLGLDYVDLYYAHRVLSLQGGMEFAKVASKLKEEGLVKEVGLSEVSGNWLQKIHTEADAVQQEWSILTRSLETELVPETAPTDWRASLPRYQKLEENKKFAEQVHEIAKEEKCTPAQVCLAWILQKAAALVVSVVPIPGTTKTERAVGHIRSAEVLLSEQNMATLDAMSKDVVGERYMENMMQNGMSIESQK